MESSSKKYAEEVKESIGDLEQAIANFFTVLANYIDEVMKGLPAAMEKVSEEMERVAKVSSQEDIDNAKDDLADLYASMNGATRKQDFAFMFILENETDDCVSLNIAENNRELRRVRRAFSGTNTPIKYVVSFTSLWQARKAVDILYETYAEVCMDKWIAINAQDVLDDLEFAAQLGKLINEDVLVTKE